MSSYHHQSGAQKRKKRLEANEKSKKNPKITSFFTAPSAGESAKASSPIESVVEASPETLCSPGSVVQESETGDNTIAETRSLDVGSPARETVELCEAESEPSTSLDVGSPAGDNVEVCEAEPHRSGELELVGGDVIDLTAIAAEKYITDRANFPITIKDPRVKRFIISHGPCRPVGPFPRDDERRCFSVSYYEKITHTGLKIPVSWLCYSPKLNSVYCEPCWLFGDRKKLGLEPAWAKSIQVWRELSKKINVHETSQTHIDTCVVYGHWRREGTIDEEQERQIRKEKGFWREVLKKIINVTLTMAMGNIAFRGHREKLGKLNSGNFLAIIELLAEYDPLLKQLLQLPQGTTKYLSPTIQNEIIEILSKQVVNDIVSEVQQAQFYSLIIDTTQDISKVDQMSQVIRYVSIKRDISMRAIEVVIQEACLGFHVVEDQSAAGIEQDILACIAKKGLSLDKCRGQGYDGAATMSGVYSGVQARIIERQENALYVHCAAHNLNLVLQDAVSDIAEISSFMTTLQQLYTFFGDSEKRWQILSSFNSESSVTLKKLCPTHWSSRFDSLIALRFRYADVLKALSKIILVSSKKSEREEAMRIKTKLESFHFIFLIVLQSKILSVVNSLSKVLQSPSMDLSRTAQLIKTAIEEVSQFRNNFDEVKKNAVLLAQN
ncbi:zinc finger MYM-type protein 1-like [Hyperolius riggenbachi]|uniref:zinc finger MYM-type protein 1-like n=1 Tax=Hyperolius riggenbachi TaxID=752182 RepID=UPI0035A37E1D